MANVVSWNDPALPVRLDYSPQAIEVIRLAAMEGLLAIPRGGVGTGGLLLGTNQAGRIGILESVRIPCSHALGPSFVLTDGEIAEARRLIERARPRVVVGWYCSKTRAALSLTDADREMYSALCPEPWQIALLVKPSASAPARAAICFRDAAGQVVQGGERELERFDPDPLAVQEPEPRRAGVTAPVPVPESPPAPLPRGPQRDLFESIVPPPDNRRKWISWLAASAIGAGAAVAFLMKDDILPRPPLKLDLADSNGHLTIRWNREAVRGIDRGSISFDDGGKLETIPLGATQLAAGMMVYERKSPRVTAVMTAGAGKALTSFFAPAPAQ